MKVKYYLSIILFICLSYISLINNSFANLTHEQANLRSKQIYNVKYNIDLDLSNSVYNPSEDTKDSPKLPLYRGKILITFDTYPEINQLSDKLFLDYTGQDGSEINNIYINNKLVDYNWDKIDRKILLSTADLNINTVNTVRIDFTNRYSRKGKGFHRAIDTEDNEVYVFTNLEPYHANEVFPLFDQPDLKATYTLETTVPNHWQVVSNTRETSITSIDNNNTKWVFEESKLFSTYLFSISAGPFHVWEQDQKSSIPLRLFARKTLAQYIDAQDWFNITSELFNTYEKYFGKYEFDKYDQIIVPEITSGAMENVGAVTFNEIYVSRSEMSQKQRTKLASVIAHEMAHMWFGDLVTMKWWDDLWLNESFATFCSGFMVNELEDKLNLEGSWQYFFNRMKTWGYEEDSYQATHPIIGEAHNTDTATANFDGITYGKGAAVLKQLYYYIGKDNFMNGVHKYFEKYKFQNTTRTDFITELSNYSNINLHAWDSEWLSTRGTNSVNILLDKNVTITPNQDPIDNKYRMHKTQVGLFGFNSNGIIELQKAVPVTYNNHPITITTDNINPVFAFSNYNDFDFSLEVYDQKTIDNLSLYLSKLDDNLVKQQVYLSLWNMVRKSQLEVNSFIDILLNSYNTATDDYLLDDIASYLKKSLHYLDLDSRRVVNNKISDILLNKLQSAGASTVEQQNSFETYLGFAKTLGHTKLISEWLQGVKTINGIDFSQEQRWLMIGALSANNYDNIENIIDKELEKDNSNLGHVSATIARLKIPTTDNKLKWYDNLTAIDKITAANTRVIAMHFHDITNPNITKFAEDKYLGTMLHLVEQHENGAKINYLASNLYPMDASIEFTKRAEEFLATNSSVLPTKIKRIIANKIEASKEILRQKY